jgi:hypothetical protein
MELVQKTLLHGLLVLSLATLHWGCQPEETEKSKPNTSSQSVPVELPGQTRLAWEGQVFDLAIEDLNADGLKDLVSVDHGKNQAQLIYQTAPQKWGEQRDYSGVGFHPGNLLIWPGMPKKLILGAEGDNSIRALAPEQGGGLNVVSNLKEVAPRYIQRFRWPGWGESLVVSPYANGYVVLLKNYDPVKGQAEQRVIVPLSSKEYSIRAAERVTVADLDGDGIDELLLVISVTNELLQIKYPGAKSKTAVPKLIQLLKNDKWGAANEAHAIDLDRDGDQDLLVPDEIGPAPKGVIHVLMNQGKGKLKEGASIPFSKTNGVQELSVARDKDGLDYFLAVGFGGVALYQMPESWKDGDAIPMRSLNWSADDYSRSIKLEDVDGDGWLDALVGRVYSDKPVWIAYGPLWQRFAELSEAGFSLK